MLKMLRGLIFVSRDAGDARNRKKYVSIDIHTQRCSHVMPGNARIKMQNTNV